MAYQLKDESGEIVKHDGNEVFAADVVGSVKGINKEDRTLVIIGSDETKDRDGDIITVAGWEMENFLKNPVFLYGHNHSGVPIGSATKVIRRKNPARLEFHEKFPTEGIYPFADMILSLFNEKVLNASSVGFIPLKWEDLPKEEGEVERWYPGRKYLKQELLELSAVSVPSNPSALQVNSLTKSFLSKSFDEIKEMMNPKERDIIMEQLFVKEIEFEDEEKPFQVQVTEQIEKKEEAGETKKETVEVFVTVKGEHENQSKDSFIIGEDDMEELKKLLEAISGRLEGLEVGQKRMEDEMVGIKTFISGLIPVETKDEENTSDPTDKKTDLYEDILSQQDNKGDQEAEDELSEEEQKVLVETIQAVKAQLK